MLPILAFDEEARTAQEMFRYTDPTGRVMNAVGDVRKLPGGNDFVAWTTWGLVIELTPSGEVAWAIQSTDEFPVTRVRHIELLYHLPDLP